MALGRTALLLAACAVAVALPASGLPAAPTRNVVAGQFHFPVGIQGQPHPLIPFTLAATTMDDGTVDGILSYDFPTTSGGWNAKWRVVDITPPTQARPYWCLHLQGIVDAPRWDLAFQDSGDGVTARDRILLLDLWALPHTAQCTDVQVDWSKVPPVLFGDIRVVD